MSDKPYSCHVCGLLSVNGPKDERMLLVTRAALVGALASIIQADPEFMDVATFSLGEIIAALRSLGVGVEG